MSEQLVAGAVPMATSLDTVHGAQTVWTRIGRQAELWVPMAFLFALLLFCFVLPLVGNLPDPVKADPFAAHKPLFTAGHLLGTDPLGFDVLSRLAYGGQISLAVGVGAAFLGLIVGGTIGVIAGYQGGLLDTIISRILDVFLAFPSLVLALTIASFLGPSIINVIFAISFFSIPAFARLARASTQRLREQVFVTAATLGGTRSPRLLTGHVVPNVLPELMTYGLLSVSSAILIEAALSFLGLGVRPPAPSWGNMISVGQQNIYNDQALLLIPSLALLLTVMSLNVLGDAIRSRWVAR